LVPDHPFADPDVAARKLVEIADTIEPTFLKANPFVVGVRADYLPFGSRLWYHDFMRKQIVQPRKKRGPPPTGKGTQIQVRIQHALLAELDGWKAKHGISTRPEAIRRLVEMGLKSKRGV
jgi:hypothetical protein